MGMLTRAIIELYAVVVSLDFSIPFLVWYTFGFILCVSSHFVVLNSTEHSNFIIILHLPIDERNSWIEWRTNAHLVWGPSRPPHNYSHKLWNGSIRSWCMSKFRLSFMVFDIEIVMCLQFYVNTEFDLTISPWVWMKSSRIRIELKTLNVNKCYSDSYVFVLARTRRLESIDCDGNRSETPRRITIIIFCSRLVYRVQRTSNVFIIIDIFVALEMERIDLH